MHVEALERQPREHRHAVIALLAIDRGVHIAEPAETLVRKAVVRALGLLQTQDVRTHGLDELRHQTDAQPHRVDVPGGDGETHRAVMDPSLTGAGPPNLDTGSGAGPPRAEIVEALTPPHRRLVR